ncbi:hypothetical protein ACFE04_018798 [Oxalis oulophora]
MAPSKDNMEKMKLRQSYRNLWHTDLINTIQADTPYCCFSFFCAPCVSYALRKRALHYDMTRYVCCAGYMSCSGRCGESRCPEFCLATEVLCCFPNSVSSTRFLLQDELNIHTTKCDNCIIGFMFCLQQLACIFSIVAAFSDNDEIEDASQVLNCLADTAYLSVCACMQTQHKVEMDKRDGKFGPQPLGVPPMQQMSRIDQPVPPNVGYPPPAAYGQPLAHPVPQAQGYPAQNYPAPQAQGYPAQNYPVPQAQGYPAQNYPAPQAQGYPAQSYPPVNYPAPGYPPK